MSKSVVSYVQQQAEVNVYFQERSSYWKDIYAASGVEAEIYRDRQAAALAWIDDLALAPGSRVLEIGCGAGFLSVALARRGLRVHAIDSTESMVELTRRQAEESGVCDLLSVDKGNVYALSFEEGSFDLVIALGVIPWLAEPVLAMREMVRVSKSGGHILLTADNRKRLNNTLDPWLNPLLVPIRRRVGTVLKQVGLRKRFPESMTATYHTRRFIDHSIVSIGLAKTRSMTLGFGPFTVMRRKIFSESRAIVLHHRLQRLADRNIPFIRTTGVHYLILARKTPVFRPPELSTGAALPVPDMFKNL